MKMLKKGLVLFAALAVLGNAGSPCRAEIIPSYGPGQIGLTSVVLCDSLSVRKGSSSDSEVVETLHYGDRLMVVDQKDGWAECFLSDDVNAEAAGWVNASFIVIDPAWYRTDEKTTVYAWNDTAALKVAQLGKDTVLPILKEDEEWVVVSLRGAAGWIHKTDADRMGVEALNAAEEMEEEEEIVAIPEEEDAFTAYAEDGSSVSIHPVGGAMYEDAKGRTYVANGAGLYYCITTDITYASNPDVWTDEEVDLDHVWTGEDFGENPDYVYDEDEEKEWTGEDFGEIPGYEYDEDMDDGEIRD